MHKKLFTGLFLAFIAATITGTLLHELGHYTVARYLGYEAEISYSATFWNASDPAHPGSDKDAFAILLGGPLQTLLTGSTGLLLLLIFRKRFYQQERLSTGQWLILFTALFWLRQSANFCVWLGGYFLNGKFSTRSDEIRIAHYLHLPAWSLLFITASIGAWVLALITFRFVPSTQRLTFLTAGFFGGIAGYILWLELFGKYILP